MDLSSSSQKPSWYYRRWFVIVMMLFVLGPFALPLLLKSPDFSKKAKIIWTLIIVALTVLMIEGTIHAIKLLIELIQLIQSQSATTPAVSS